MQNMQFVHFENLIKILIFKKYCRKTKPHPHHWLGPNIHILLGPSHWLSLTKTILFRIIFCVYIYYLIFMTLNNLSRVYRYIFTALYALWIANGPNCLQTEREESDQTGCMPRLN